MYLTCKLVSTSVDIEISILEMQKAAVRVSLKPLPQTGNIPNRGMRELSYGRPSSRNDLVVSRPISRTENRLDEGNLKAWNRSFEEEIADPDTSVDDSEYQSESGMSLSDLNSLGFDSQSAPSGSLSVFSGPSSLLSEAVPRPNTESYGAIGGLLKGPYIRALYLISKFMEANNAPQTPKACAMRRLCAPVYQELSAACRDMFILALKRDMLSRLSALFLVIEKIPRLVESGDYAALLSEIKLHSRHVSDLQALHNQFLTLLPSLTLPSLASAEARFVLELRRAVCTACSALVRRIDALAGVTPLPETQVRSHHSRFMAIIAAVSRLRIRGLRRLRLSPSPSCAGPSLSPAAICPSEVNRAGPCPALKFYPVDSRVPVYGC